jgi:hypothetical protein
MAAQAIWASKRPAVNHNASFDIVDATSANVALESSETSTLQDDPGECMAEAVRCRLDFHGPHSFHNAFSLRRQVSVMMSRSSGGAHQK